jgi:AraC-like DNA-binding protein
MTSPSANSYSYTLGVGALNGFIVAALLLRARGQRMANRLLAALVAVVALRLVPYILGYAGFYDAYPWLSFAPFDLALAVGPLLWLYVATLTGGRMPATWRWHLLPALAQLLLWGGVFAIATVPQKTWIDGHVLPWLLPPIELGGTAGFAVYTAAAYRRFVRYQRWLDDNLSSREEYRIGWLRALIVLLAITALMMTAFLVTDWFVVPLSYFDEYPLYLWMTALCYTMGLLAWRGSATVYPTPGDVSEPATPLPVVHPVAGGDGPALNDTAIDQRAAAEDRTATSTDWTALGERYAEQIRAAGWWRDAQLTLPILARRLGTNTTYLSRALNAGLQTSFNQFVNRLRAESVAERLRAGDDRDLMAIATEAGFNSKASFQRAFREHVGGTAGEYRQRVRDEDGGRIPDADQR